MDQPLDAIARDEWDRAAFKAAYHERMAPRWKAMEQERRMEAAIAAEDWDRVETMLDERIAADPQNGNAKMQKFVTMLLQMNQPKRAYAYAGSLLDEHWDDSGFLNGLSWFIATNPSIRSRDLKIAMRAADRANELTQERDPSILDTVARIHFEMGDVAKAIRIQKAAVAAGEGTSLEADLKKTLEEYEAEG